MYIYIYVYIYICIYIYMTKFENQLMTKGHLPDLWGLKKPTSTSQCHCKGPHSEIPAGF